MDFNRASSSTRPHTPAAPPLYFASADASTETLPTYETAQQAHLASLPVHQSSLPQMNRPFFSRQLTAFAEAVGRNQIGSEFAALEPLVPRALAQLADSADTAVVRQVVPRQVPTNEGIFDRLADRFLGLLRPSRQQPESRVEERQVVLPELPPQQLLDILSQIFVWRLNQLLSRIPTLAHLNVRSVELNATLVESIVGTRTSGAQSHLHYDIRLDFGTPADARNFSVASNYGKVLAMEKDVNRFYIPGNNTQFYCVRNVADFQRLMETMERAAGIEVRPALPVAPSQNHLALTQ